MRHLMRSLGAVILLIGSSRAFLSSSTAGSGLSRAATRRTSSVGTAPLPLATARREPFVRRRFSTRLLAVSPEIGEVLSGYGVPADKHDELIAKLTPLLNGKGQKSSKLDVEVVRGENGGLGIDVDQDNIIQGNAGQPNLKVGDKIVAVDGEQLAGRPIAEVLTPGKGSYTFAVMRGVESARSLEDKISLLAADQEMFTGANGLSGQDPTKSVEQFLSASEALEELGEAIEEKQLKGFWKLAYTNDLTFVANGGASGLAAMPYCSLAAHWQCYQDKDPTGQTVEVVANANVGTHSIAALKGAWKLGEQEATEAGVQRPLTESYRRVEYGGSPQGGGGMVKEGAVTYVGKSVRISRKQSASVVGRDGEMGAGAAVYVYVRKSGEEVQGQLQQWMERDVPGAAGGKGPRWERPEGGSGGRESMLRD